MRVKIISDSTCDLSPALLERYDIAVTPLCVIKDGKDFHDGVDITPADIFAHVDGGGDLCSTSAVSQYEYGEMFARYANEYDAVVQITIGANFSCCYQNACAAAQEYENVFVVDSENLSTGQGLLVVAAAKLAEGWMLEQIRDYTIENGCDPTDEEYRESAQALQAFRSQQEHTFSGEKIGRAHV